MNADLDKNKYFISTENNFDFIRFISAFGIFSYHFLMLNHLDVIFSSEKLVCVFFVVSGILVYRSYERSVSLKVYLEKRFRRIVPAYILIVLLCAVGGCIVSTLSYKEYFLSTELYKYILWNGLFMNFIHPNLPGVMDGATINPSLWTIKVELFCYFLIPVFSKVVEKLTNVAMVKMTAIVCALSACCRFSADLLEFTFLDIIGKYLLVVDSFMVGICMYLFFDQIIKLKRKYFWIFVSFFVLAIDGFFSNLLTPMAVGFLVFVFSFSIKGFNGFGKIGDPSYSLYLCHGPIVMLFIWMGFPGNLLTYAVETIIVLSFSLCSWHLFEKKILLSAKPQNSEKNHQ